MDRRDHGSLLSTTLLAEIEAIAAEENRSTRDVLQEIVTGYLRERRENDKDKVKPAHSPQEAARLMMERRPFNKLPEGTTIRDLMTYGRM